MDIPHSSRHPIFAPLGRHPAAPATGPPAGSPRYGRVATAGTIPRTFPSLWREGLAGGTSMKFFHYTRREVLPKWKVAALNSNHDPRLPLDKLTGERARELHGACGERGTMGSSGPGRMLRSPTPHPAGSQALPHEQVARPWAPGGCVERGTQRLTSARLGARTPLLATRGRFTFLHPCRLLGSKCPLGVRRGARRSPCR